MVDRRRFVTALAATLVAAGVPAAFAPLAHAGPRKLTARWWRKKLHERAELHGNIGTWRISSTSRRARASRELEQFSLKFRGSLGDQISEWIYTVKVGRHKVKLLVQPAGQDEAWNYYISSISRLRRRPRRRRRHAA